MKHLLPLLLILISCNSNPSSGEVVDDDTNMVIHSIYMDSVTPIHDTIYYRSTNYGEQSKKPFEVIHTGTTSTNIGIRGEWGNLDTLPDDYRIGDGGSDIELNPNGGIYLGSTATRSPGGFIISADSVTTPTYDTTRCMMLLSDTAQYMGQRANSVSGSWPAVNYPDVPLYSYACYWQFGYEVRMVEKRNNTDGVIDPGFNPGFVYKEWDAFFHVEYLSANKLPLPKNIIVWQTRSL